MIADHNLVKKSFGPMIADHDLVNTEVSTHTFLTMIIEEYVCLYHIRIIAKKKLVHTT
jgi:hypothetical protein